MSTKGPDEKQLAHCCFRTPDLCESDPGPYCWKTVLKEMEENRALGKQDVRPHTPVSWDDIVTRGVQGDDVSGTVLGRALKFIGGSHVIDTGTDAWDLGLYASRIVRFWRFAFVQLELGEHGPHPWTFVLFTGDLKKQLEEFAEGFSK